MNNELFLTPFTDKLVGWRKQLFEALLDRGVVSWRSLLELVSGFCVVEGQLPKDTFHLVSEIDANTELTKGEIKMGCGSCSAYNEYGDRPAIDREGRLICLALQRVATRRGVYPCLEKIDANSLVELAIN